MVFKKLNLNLNHLNDQKFVLNKLKLRGVNNPFNSLSDGCNPHLNVPIPNGLLTIIFPVSNYLQFCIYLFSRWSCKWCIFCMYLACIKYFNICIKKFVSTKPTIRIALELLKIKCITIDKYMDQFDVNINFIELALHRPWKRRFTLKYSPK